MSKAKAETLETGPVERIKWLDDVADHDYDAAEAYLSLKLDEEAVHKTVKRLRKASLTTRRANDILRAAGLTAAPLDDPGVMKDLIKVIEGKTSQPGARGQCARSAPTSPTAITVCRSCTASTPTANVPLKLA